MGNTSGLKMLWVSTSGLQHGIDDGADDCQNTMWDGRVLTM